MRAVIQRVLHSSVTVEQQTIGKIDQGICVLVGITHTDTMDDLNYISNKILNCRLFDNWKKSVKDLNLQVLIVSQFTLYGNLYKGNKPDFHDAMKSEQSFEMYQLLLDKLRMDYDASKIEQGKFGHMMKVEIVNDGPVTLIVDSQVRKKNKTNAVQ